VHNSEKHFDMSVAGYRPTGEELAVILYDKFIKTLQEFNRSGGEAAADAPFVVAER